MIVIADFECRSSQPPNSGDERSTLKTRFVALPLLFLSVFDSIDFAILVGVIDADLFGRRLSTSVYEVSRLILPATKEVTFSSVKVHMLQRAGAGSLMFSVEVTIFSSPPGISICHCRSSPVCRRARRHQVYHGCSLTTEITAKVFSCFG